MSMVIMKIPAVDGECKVQKYEGLILCESLSHDMEVEMEVTTNARRTIHTPKVNNISIDRKWDTSSPELIKRLLRAAVVDDEWTIHCLKTAGNDNNQMIEYLTMVLTNPIIAKHTLNVNEGDTTETIEINATKITWKYQSYNEKQQKAGSSGVTFDLLTGTVE